MGRRLILLDQLSHLSGRGKFALAVALVVIIPIAGWLGYRLGFMLGSS